MTLLPYKSNSGEGNSSINVRPSNSAPAPSPFTAMRVSSVIGVMSRSGIPSTLWLSPVLLLIEEELWVKAKDVAGEFQVQPCIDQEEGRWRGDCTFEVIADCPTFAYSTLCVAILCFGVFIRFQRQAFLFNHPPRVSPSMWGLTSLGPAIYQLTWYALHQEFQNFHPFLIDP